MTDINIPFTKDWHISWGSYWFKKYSVEFNILPSIDVYIDLNSKHRFITFSWLTLWFQISRFNSDALRKSISSMIEK